jgi:adenylate cyclase
MADVSAAPIHRPTRLPLGPVLVVDPNEDARHICEVLLAHAGYDVMLAADGEEAWALAHAVRPGLVVTELYVPVCGEPCLVGALKRDRALPGLPVLVVSAHAFPSDHTWAVRSGGDVFLSKPVRPREFLAAVRHLLGRR